MDLKTPIIADKSVMKHSLDVVMPVCNQCKFTEEILGYIDNCTVQPRQIILIDNGSDDRTKEIVDTYKERLRINYVFNDVNIGVNASWNLGLSMSDADVVSILNNDLIILPYFFEKILITFEDFPVCGYVIPLTLESKGMLNGCERNNGNDVTDAPYRQGWAFSMRRKIFEKSGPIPSELFTFYGDDFLFGETLEQGYRAFMMLDNPIFHYLSQSLYSSGGADHFGDDLQNWSMYMAKKTGRVRKYNELPAHIDMSPYAPFYQEHLRRIIEREDLKKQRKNIVEIGSRFGCSARIMLEVIEKDANAKLILIEPMSSIELAEIIDGVKVEHWMSTGEERAADFEDQSIDLLHIDADPHAYEQTENLFTLYKNKIQDGGAIIFHDCTDFFGVGKFVKEVLAKMAGWEVIFCSPSPESQISAPAIVYRRIT